MTTLKPHLFFKSSNLTAALLSVFVLVPLTAVGTEAPADIPLLGHALHRLGPVGAQGWGETDVDGDGRTDLVTTAAGPAALILIYGRASGDSSSLTLKQSLFGAPDSIAALATAPSGDARVVSIGVDRTATLYGGWPLAAVGSFDVAHATEMARIGDLDADGTLELLCAGGGMLSAYSLPDGTLEWSMSMQVADIELVSLDADPALEIVLAGGDSAPGTVLDGATRLPEWIRPEGFGTYVAAGVFGPSGASGFLGARDWDSLSGFATTPYALAWSLPNFDTDGVAAGDTDADGLDEFAVGDGQWGSVRVYESPSRQMLYQMANPGHGIWALGMLDFDADARDEVWFSARIENNSDFEGNFAAAIMNPINAQPRLTIESYRQGATASLLADLDQDGSLEWVIGTSGDFAFRGLLRVLDASTQREEWRAPYQAGNAFEPFQTGYRSLHAAQLDSDPAMELVAIGAIGSGESRLLVIDGSSHAVERQTPAPITRWYTTISASRLVQHVAGGAPELLVATHSYLAPENVGLEVYSLPAGNLLWSTATVGGPNDKGLSLDVGQLDADASAEYLLAHTGGLSAFDAATGLQWTLPLQTAGALILPDPIAPSILSFTSEGVVTRIDPVSGLASGGFTLPAPIEKLAHLPGADDLLLAIAGQRLLLLDLQGEVLAQSAWIGTAPGAGENLHVVRESGAWLISVGRSFTTFQLRLQDPAFIFANGFE